MAMIYLILLMLLYALKEEKQFLENSNKNF